jgi:RNA polymerase sigma factor (sigma-70 family)
MSQVSPAVRPRGELFAPRHEREEGEVSDQASSGFGDHLAAFEARRPRMMGICYRILGSVTDAEDVLQDAWFRWSRTDVGEIDNVEAFLTTVVSRLALDRLRRVKARRESYPGSWLPEPVAAADDPAAAVELGESLSMALLVVLEALSPLERAAFVLHEVFQQPYPEVATALGREEPAVRQLVHRARLRVDAGATRYRADRDTHSEVVRRFAIACATADVDSLLAVLAPDVVVISDGGGVAKAPLLPVNGRDRVARLLLGIAKKIPVGATYDLEVFNGQLGLVARLDGRAINALAVTVREDLVQTLHAIANPAKLTALDTQHGVVLD